MRKSSSFFYALSLYTLISVFFTAAQYLLAGALIYFLFQFVNLSLGPDRLYLVKASAYDSAGFAFLTVTNTILQYYLASLLARNLKGRTALFGILLLSAAVADIFFLKLSARSSFGSYTFASFPLIVSYLLGGVMGLLQKEEENPFHNSRLNLFRID
ncbi:MAG: hypothetical protein A2X28_08800 [Elusimicrobia bacterium GWA2_56_46]|nr:MAG: hypothetical protein A2X28_08800 [Elusimicrobia bacterium GWA2_56_46]OGR54405.1 MAG: hypothetical protein A2X39_03875 [Elusimicrobia bacterium GWC2_56_31]HBB67086.1 hypothetical protein [Elusimicrobiota bacterium]HBW23485.1 hypothetical protein [Elusimicrobiota bacterium]